MIPAFETLPLVYLQKVKGVEIIDTEDSIIKEQGPTCYYICWTNDETDNEAHAITLTKLISILNDESLLNAADLRILVNIRMMPLSFITTHLYKWVQELQPTKGWVKITRCGIIINSECTRTMMSLFSSDKRVSYHTTLLEACNETGIDIDTLL